MVHRAGGQHMKVKFDRILCPVQFDQNSAAAVHFALKLAQPGSKMYLLHVVPQEDTESAASISALARECLQDFAREQPLGKLKPELLVCNGDPAAVILKVASELRVDLIVMATHGHKRLARLLLGSVAERVLREARPPVLTLRPEVQVQPNSA
jgi:universal stress protein A